MGGEVSGPRFRKNLFFFFSNEPFPKFADILIWWLFHKDTLIKYSGFWYLLKSTLAFSSFWLIPKCHKLHVWTIPILGVGRYRAGCGSSSTSIQVSLGAFRHFNGYSIHVCILFIIKVMKIENLRLYNQIKKTSI